MTEETLIELNDDELLAVSGGGLTVAGIVQSIDQSAAILQHGGSALAIFGGVDFDQTLTATIEQAAANVNSGSVSVGGTMKD
jgi:hypothetical protein